MKGRFNSIANSDGSYAGCTQAPVRTITTYAARFDARSEQPSEHLHGLRGSVKYPHGHGFMAATSMKEAGKLTVANARAMDTVASSRGCRNASNDARENSGNSSRKSTP